MANAFIIQAISVLYVIYAIRIKMWRLSLNTFTMFIFIFFIVITWEIPVFNSIWTQYPMEVMTLFMTIMLLRVFYQHIIALQYRHHGKDRRKRIRTPL